jgi:hypothetical protein
MALINHDALLAERTKLPAEKHEHHYIMTEMINPLKGGEIVGGYVGDAGAQSLFPVLLVRLDGVIYQVVVSMDDEQNGGGRLFIEEERA